MKQHCRLAIAISIALTANLVLAQGTEDLVNITPGEQDGTRPAPTSDPAPDLGEKPDLSNGSLPAPLAPLPAVTSFVEPGTASRAVAAAQRKGQPRKQAALRQEIERVTFNRRPVGVALPVGQERLVTLPSAAVLHVPEDIEVAMRLETIGRTVYATALRPFAPLRIVAELIDSGEQVPLDLVANEGTASATAEIEVFLDERILADRQATPELATDEQEQEQQQAADMVQLTRHASRALYAPRRLAHGTAGVTQVNVEIRPVPGLIRGALVETTPVGQWRSGNLWVTAVVVRNLARTPLDVPLEDVRGQWLAATAQHGRIGPAGSETDTTAIYLVCQRPFDSCH